MGVYGTSTFFQGEPSTPSAHPIPSSSMCTSLSTIGNLALSTSAPSTASSTSAAVSASPSSGSASRSASASASASAASGSRTSSSVSLAPGAGASSVLSANPTSVPVSLLFELEFLFGRLSFPIDRVSSQRFLCVRHTCWTNTDYVLCRVDRPRVQVPAVRLARLREPRLLPAVPVQLFQQCASAGRTLWWHWVLY